MTTTERTTPTKSILLAVLTALAVAALTLGLAANPASAKQHDDDETSDGSDDGFCQGEEIVVDPFCDEDYDWDVNEFEDVWCHITAECGGGGGGGGGGDGDDGEDDGDDQFCQEYEPFCEEPQEPSRVRTIITTEGRFTLSEG